MLTSLKRITKFGWEKFSREKASTIGSLMILIAAICIATGIFLVNGASKLTIAALQEAVDISVYFHDSALEEEVFAVRDRVNEISGVANIEYVSKEEALERFRERHEDNETIIRALEAVGENPLHASLNIRTERPEQLATVAEVLEQDEYAEIIYSIDYRDRIAVIDRISAIAEGLERAVLVVSIIAGVIAVIVVFNTIRLMIYISREEIQVMRLVGASNWFIRGPFLIQGIIVGVLASIISLALFVGAAFLIPTEMEIRTLGFSLSQYFIDNILIAFGIQLAVGVGLGVVSAGIAIRRYLKV